MADTAYIHGSAAACAGFSYERLHQTAKKAKLNGRSLDVSITNHCVANTADYVKRAIDAERQAARDGRADEHVAAILATRYHGAPHPRLFDEKDVALQRRMDFLPLDAMLASEWPVSTPARSTKHRRLAPEDADALSDVLRVFEDHDGRHLQLDALAPARSFANMEVRWLLPLAPCLPSRIPLYCSRCLRLAGAGPVGW